MFQNTLNKNNQKSKTIIRPDGIKVILVDNQTWGEVEDRKKKSERNRLRKGSLKIIRKW